MTTRTRIGWWLAWLATAFAFIVPLRGLLRAAGGPMEEGFMLVFPERILHGAVANRDFLHLYGPSSLWVLAIIYKIFGSSITVERLAGLSQHVSVAVWMLVALRPYGPFVAGVSAVMAVILLIAPVGLVALAWVGGVALGLWFVFLLARSVEHPAGSVARRRLLLTAGLLAGFSLTYRPDLIVAIGLVCLGAMGWFGWTDRRRFAVGFGVGLLPIVIYVLQTGPGRAFHATVIRPVFDLRPGRHLPVPPNTHDLDGFLQKIAELAPVHWPAILDAPHQINAWFYFLMLAGVTVVVAGLLAGRGRTLSPGDRILRLAGLFAVGILPQAIQRPDTTHLAWVGCVVMPLLPPALVSLAGRHATAGPKRIVVALLAPVLAFGFILPWYSVRNFADYTKQSITQKGGTIHHDGRSFYHGRAGMVAAFRELAPDLDRISQPGDRLIVGPADLRRTTYSDAWIYYLFPHLVPGTQYIEMDPGIADASGSGLADELRRADVVVLNREWDNWTEPNASSKFGSDEPNQVIDEDFCLVDVYGDLLELYQRCHR